MKLTRTESLETAPSFRARFHGAFEAGKRIKPEINLVGERHSKVGRWKAALLKWHKIKSGALNAQSAAAVMSDNAEKFAYFDKHGGRLPMGL
jgi:hypothetical protein